MGFTHCRWSKIASRLPGRTDNEIKNVWNTHLKKRLLPTTTIISESSGEEPKESPTTSSSSSESSLSSNQNQNLETQPLNNNIFCLEEQQQTTSSLSTNTSNSNSNSNSNSSSQVEFWPQNSIDLGEEVNNMKENKNMRLELELESVSPSNNMGIEIPLECDIDFWNMLDLDNIDLSESNEVDQNYCQGSNFGSEKNRYFENDKWFKYLENELGLDRPPNESDGGAGTDKTTATEGLLLVDVDPFMAYFADGFTQQL